MNVEVHVPSDVGALLDAAGHQPSRLELVLVERLMGGRAALPMLPAVAQEALTLVNNPDASVAAFARLIEKDPPIAARFLSVANSALYSRGRKVSTMSEAVMRLGIYGCRDLLMQVVYASTLTGLKKYQDAVQASFRRSVTSGLLCRAVCAELDLSFKEAYLCGLLHDIGESRTYRILSEIAEPQEDDEVPLLVQRYHERAGAELAQMWKLPDEIQKVCMLHHTSGPAAGEGQRIVRIADLAMEAVETLAAGKSLDKDALASTAGLEALQIDGRRLCAVVERAAAMVSML